jgi:putative transposase
MEYRRIFADGYSYYLTLVTYQRKPILIDNIEQLRQAFRYSKKNYDYTIDAIVILPDHLHMIITPKIANEYPKIITNIKRAFVYTTVGRGILTPTIKDTKTNLSSSKYKRSHAGIWQERYYEHTIRNEKDLLEKMEYIKNNPIKHALVDNINDWKYSSFT